MKKLFLICLLTTYYLLLTTAPAQAATLTVDPSAGKFGPGDTFIATLRLTPDTDECVNAVSGAVTYPTDWLKVSAISKGESLFTLWPEEPKNDPEKGVVRFSAGIPAGYCGRVSGDPGESNIIGKIVFSVPGNMIGGKRPAGGEEMVIAFGPDTAVYLNDGFGTVAPLTLVSARYERTLAAQGIPNEWVDAVHDDKIPPDAFEAAVTKDPGVFGGKYFLVFSANDKQSGVEHYEVREDDGERLGYVRDKKIQAEFKPATSPYVLEDQTLHSRVTVRAFDFAGNMQESVVPPQGLDLSTLNVSKGHNDKLTVMVVAGITACLLFSGGVVWWIRRGKKPGDGDDVT